MRSITIIGTGRMGGALAIALERAGFDVAVLVHRGKVFSRTTARAVHWGSFDRVETDVVLIAVDDPNIGAVAERLAKIGGDSVVLHPSGSLSSDILSAARNVGYKVGSVHPLVSISDSATGAERFSGAFFCVEGDAEAVEAANEIVIALGGETFSIATKDKPLYHAAAVSAAGHLAALIDISVEMLSRCGMESERAKEILMPLVESTISNLRSRSIADALTGSFARGDREAVERHLNSFEGRISDEVRDVYLNLGSRSVEIAARREPGSGRLKNLGEFISLAKQKSGC